MIVGEIERRVVVSIHDVAPPFQLEIQRLLEALAAIGVPQPTLNIVPNWHGAFPLCSAPSLVRLLQAQSDLGSELVLHGFEHHRAGPLRGPAHLRLRADLFAGDAAEFLTLAPERAAQRIQEGRAVLVRAGLPTPSSFCAPGWLLAPDLAPVLQECGIRLVIGMLTVRDLDASKSVTMQAAGQMGAGAWHELGVGLGNALTRLILRARPVMSVYFHPQAGEGAWASRRVLGLLGRLIAQGWRPASFAEIMSDNAAER